jgi:HK97 family phage portal protein
MGLLTRVSTVATPVRMRAAWGGADDDRWFVPSAWLGAASSAGVRVSPDGVMAGLSAVYCAVTTIADDIGSLSCGFFKRRPDGGRDYVQSGEPGIGVLVDLLGSQPNDWQTAKDFWSMMIGHLLLRSTAYAEQIYRPGGSFIDQLIPRHPDRVTPKRLPNGRLIFVIARPDGTTDTRTQEEMFVLRGMSLNGITGVSPVTYGAQALGTAMAAEQFAGNFFRQGASASKALVHKGGELDEEGRKDLHASISTYMSGVQNAGGFLVIEDDIEIKDLAFDPQKAQLLDTRERGIKEVARLWKFPGHKLEAEQQTQAYAAREQANLEYVMTCLRPIIVGIEQSIRRDLIIQQHKYFAKFSIKDLFRGDMKTLADYYKNAIRNRWMTPNEVRMEMDLNPIAGGDELCPWNTTTAAIDGAEGGQAAHAADRSARTVGSGRTARAALRSTLIVHDNAIRVLRRERAAVEKLAKKHASDADGWSAGLRDFYADHATFIAQTLRISMTHARAVAAQHGTELEANGIVVMDDAWERAHAEDLTALALEDGAAA